mgnify:CR=1 FL=1
MFGITIIKTNELKRLQEIDERFNIEIGERNKEVFFLKNKLAKFDRKREHGKFVKSIQNDSNIQ